MSQYIPFHVASDTYVPSEVVNLAISKVWSFLNRKKAYLGEMTLKERKAALAKARNRFFGNLREECRPSIEEAQFFVSYSESLPFGGGHLTLQDAFRRLAAQYGLRDEETGAVLDAAIVTAIVERVRAVLHSKGKKTIRPEYEVAPLTADKNLHRWNPAALYFTQLSRLEAAEGLFAKSEDSEVDKWTKVQVADVSLEPEPLPEKMKTVPMMMTAIEAIAKAQETQMQLQALKETKAQAQIDAAIILPVLPLENGASAS